MSDDTFDYLNSVKKFQNSGLVERQIQSSIESNEANTKLAQETLKHFQDSKISSDNALKNAKDALTASKLLTGLTIFILAIQTYMATRPQVIESPTIKSELTTLIEEIKASQIRQEQTLNLIQTSDSLKLELRELSMKLDSAYLVINKLNNKKNDTRRIK